jgi:alpha-ketoglutarate-dependent taurine dioxygenase
LDGGSNIEGTGDVVAELLVKHPHPWIGAEVRGIEPGQRLDDAQAAQLRQVFDDRSVVVFPDLDIDEAFQRYLVYATIGQEAPEKGLRPEPMLVSNKEPGGAAPYGRLLFHCDMMWSDTIEPNLSLYGQYVEQPTSPTMFASMVHAWETLPEQLRQRVQGLEARHGHEHYYPNRGGDEEVIDAYYEEAQFCVKPIAFTHPRTGKTVLYVSQQVTMDVVGLEHAENEALLEELFAHLYAEENVLAHYWKTGDLVVWDNVSVQHARGPVTLEGPTRTLRKVIGPVDAGAMRTGLPSFSKLPG